MPQQGLTPARTTGTSDGRSANTYHRVKFRLCVVH
jgi:hypothetical protein